LVSLIAIKQLWTERLRPWVENTWGDLRAGELVNLPIVGRVDQADVIGLGVLVTLSLVALGVVAGNVRRPCGMKSGGRHDGDNAVRPLSFPPR
jgi:hypothetical protein